MILSPNFGNSQNTKRKHKGAQRQRKTEGPNVSCHLFYDSFGLRIWHGSRLSPGVFTVRGRASNGAVEIVGAMPSPTWDRNR